MPPAFFERNEAIWRGRVRPDALEDARGVKAVAVDFWGADGGGGGDAVKYVDGNSDGRAIIDLSDARESKNPVVQDIFNNQIALRAIPSWAKKESKDDHRDDAIESRPPREAASAYFHPRDRNGKVLRNQYISERVREAMAEYVEACADARSEVERVLTRLAGDILLNLILSTAAHHASSSNARGWNLGSVYDDDEGDESSSSAGRFRGVWPHWMDRSESVPNTFDLDGLFLLTATNMSGKSTLMRSAAAAALLVNCGLCAPADAGTRVRRFDSLFVRGASADVPAEDRSAFGAEMGDVSALLRSCGRRSLVFVDEIGRGTSPRDGTSLAGAILEGMAEGGMSGAFATHLHGVLDLPFSARAGDRLRRKRMAIREEDGGVGWRKWTYTLEDGVCTDSLALLTAAEFGLPESILRRAEELSKCLEAGDAFVGDRSNEESAGPRTWAAPASFAFLLPTCRPPPWRERPASTSSE